MVPRQGNHFLFYLHLTIVKITGDGFKSLYEGKRVQFDILKGQRGSQAENIIDLLPLCKYGIANLVKLVFFYVVTISTFYLITI
ncbi:hypothetical protein JOC85_004412 [Bacillus mesophilus]|uniref:Cold shock domain-containing protein n=1 Tax=Bacillus mesophilus TaxID=1808955 RepID=A0A6M0QD08_9BACI|nr:cold shock domain-containing protein [Bacillus mesophilus]MBM7663534.1 hypothetical protein [Bacillus mesophilus]NEY74243.1 cold shock domain-containing protein [Bacillus mesophilus]